MANGDILKFGAWKVTTSVGDVRFITATGYAQSVMYDAYARVELETSYKNSDAYEWKEFQYNGNKAYVCNNFGFSYISYEQVVRNFLNKAVNYNGMTYRFILVPTSTWKTTIPTALAATNYNFFIDVDVLTSTTGGNGVLVATTTGSQENTEFAIRGTSVATTHKDSDVYFVPVLIMENAAPTISGADTDLGAKTNGFSVSYSVADVNSNQELTVTERLNGATIRTLHNPTQGEIFSCVVTDELFAGLAMNSTNTLEIEVSDGSAAAYRRYTFSKNNSIPLITYTGDYDLGELTSIPNIKYSVSDIEGNALTVTEKINGSAIRTFTVANGTSCTVEISEYFWLTCGSSANIVEIHVTDQQGGSSFVHVTFSRQVNKVQIETANAIETDIAATKILLSPRWTTKNCTWKAEACNNGFDDNPTWEDITSMVNEARPYSFTNTTKKASKWGIKVRLTVVKNKGYTGEAAIYGFGGAYE